MVNILEDDVKEAILRLSDVDLTRLVEVDFREHTEEAVAFARTEMARRGIGGSAQSPSVQGGPEPEVRKPSKWRSLLGAVCLVIAVVPAYLAAVIIAICATDKDWEGSAVLLPLCAAAIALPLWVGIRRQTRWELYVAIPSAILAALTFVAHVAISSEADHDPSGLIVTMIMAGLALIFFLVGMAKRGRNPGAVATQGIQAGAQGPSGQIALESEPAASKSARRRQLWGGVWLVVAAVSASLVAFGIARYFVDPRSRKGFPYILSVFAVLTGLFIWAGIKRRPRWEFFLAVTFAVLAALQLAGRINLPAATQAHLLFRKAQLITIIVMIVLAIGLFLLGMVKRRRAVEAPSS